MKVFISWSGEFSMEVAKKLSEWIPAVLQHVKVFYSPDDIEKGDNWNQILSKELNESNYGLICLTPQNITAPWIHFEGGALAKSLDSKLSALMLSIAPSDIKGPLSRYQNTSFTREDMFKLVQSINKTSGEPISDIILTRTFNGMWSDFEEEVRLILDKYSQQDPPLEGTKKTSTSTNDAAVEEILRLVRKIDTSVIGNASLDSYNDKQAQQDWSSSNRAWSSNDYSVKMDLSSRGRFKMIIRDASLEDEKHARDIFIENNLLPPKKTRSGDLVGIIPNANTTKEILYKLADRNLNVLMSELE